MPPLLFPSPLFRQTTEWFDRARAALLGEVPCREGCHRCCIGLFPVTLLDRRSVLAGLRSLPEEHRRAIRANAAAQAETLTAAAPRLTDTPLIDGWTDVEVDRLVERYRDLRCPALLENGRCAIYEYRPLACRSMGIPTDDGHIVEGACEIQSFVPIRRLPASLREEEDRLARSEAEELAAERRRTKAGGEELLLPFAFLDVNAGCDLDSVGGPVLR